MPKEIETPESNRGAESRSPSIPTGQRRAAQTAEKAVRPLTALAESADSPAPAVPAMKGASKRRIKTREVQRDIKVRSPVRPAARQVTQAALKTKDAAAKQLEAPQASPNEYGGELIEGKSKSLASGAIHVFDQQGRRAIKQLDERAKTVRAKKAADAASAAEDAAEAASSQSEAAAPEKAKQKNKRRSKKEQAGQRSRAKKSIAPDKKPAAQGDKTKSAKKKTKPQKAGRKIGRGAKNAKTAMQGQQAAKSAAKSAKTAKQTAQRARQVAEQTIKATKTAVKATYKAVKAAIQGTKLLVEAIVAGGWVAVVIILIICLFGLLLASPFGIFFSGEGEKTMPQVIAELSAEHYGRLDALQFNYVHDLFEMEGEASINWAEVLAVYAVQTNTDPLDADEVVTFTEKKIDKLRKVLNDMNQFTYSVKSAQTTRTVVYTNAQGQELERTETILMRTLTVEVTQKSAAEMAEAYGFNEKERALLDELLDPRYADMWAMLLGGYAPGGGTVLDGDSTWTGAGIFEWPMQAGDYSRISSKYGYRDNPTNPGEIKFHGGIDLAADEGIPILAAADGIVTIANATDRYGSYGLYVKIQHQGGYETLYAHCSGIAVRKDEEVHQGQVIAYVGSTGNSTGNHLHFEVRKDGSRVNPLGFFVAK